MTIPTPRPVLTPCWNANKYSACATCRRASHEKADVAARQGCWSAAWEPDESGTCAGLLPTATSFCPLNNPKCRGSNCFNFDECEVRK